MLVCNRRYIPRFGIRKMPVPSSVLTFGQTQEQSDAAGNTRRGSNDTYGNDPSAPTLVLTYYRHILSSKSLVDIIPQTFRGRFLKIRQSILQFIFPFFSHR